MGPSEREAIHGPSWAAKQVEVDTQSRTPPALLTKGIFRHAAAVERLQAGLSAGGMGAALGGRGAVRATPTGASSISGSTVRLERFQCPRCVLSRLACDNHMWQAVVAVGDEVHRWRLEVQLWRPAPVRAQLFFALSRSAPHPLCPSACPRQPPCSLHLQPTHPCPAFDLLLHSAARPTGVITTVGSAVAAAFSAAAQDFLDDLVLQCAAAAVARRCQAAQRCFKRRPKWPMRRSSAAAIFGRRKRVARVFSGGSGCSSSSIAARRLHRSAVSRCEKKCFVSACLSPVCARVCGARVRGWKLPTLRFPTV